MYEMLGRLTIVVQPPPLWGEKRLKALPHALHQLDEGPIHTRTKWTHTRDLKSDFIPSKHRHQRICSAINWTMRVDCTSLVLEKWAAFATSNRSDRFERLQSSLAGQACLYVLGLKR